MISLLNVLKPGILIYTDDIYTIQLKEPEPDITAGIEVPAASDNIPEIVDEDAVWQRLKARLEEERKAVLKAANDEAGFIRNQAYNAGYEKGIGEKTGEIGELIARSEKILQEMERAVSLKMRELDENLSLMACEIASKVLARKVEEDDRILCDVVKKAVDEARNSEWVSVTLSERLGGALDGIEQELRRGKITGRIEVRAKDLPKDTCIVETPDGIIDASIHNQLENLKSYLI